MTTLTSAASSAPTFAVANTADSAPLRLAEQVLPGTDAGFGSGDLSNLAGDLYYTAGGGSGPVTTFVYTPLTASQLVPIRPQRVLDTRNTAGRSNILNRAGNLDSAGRLIANHAIVIDLSGLVVATGGAFCNLTAVQPLSGGYLTLWPDGSRPATSSLNFAAGAVIANFAVTGTSATDTVSIYASTTTHVGLDVTAFAVGSAAQVNPAVLSATVAVSARRLEQRRRAGSLPSWYRAR